MSGTLGLLMPVDASRREGPAPGETVRYRLDADESPTLGVLEAVAAASGRSVLPEDADADTEPLPPLFEAIDPDALDAFHRSTEGSETDARIVFTYAGYDVTVGSDGDVVVTPA